MPIVCSSKTKKDIGNKASMRNRAQRNLMILSCVTVIGYVDIPENKTKHHIRVLWGYYLRLCKHPIPHEMKILPSSVKIGFISIFLFTFKVFGEYVDTGDTRQKFE